MNAASGFYMRFKAALFTWLLLATVVAKKKKNDKPKSENSGSGSEWFSLPELGERWAAHKAQIEAECKANPHYICKDGKCVSDVNVRCNGIEQCPDKSDETNCTVLISPTAGQSPSTHYVDTTPKIELATSNSSSSCVLPEQPVGGSFERSPCDGPACSVAPGTRVPSQSFLFYSCDEGYTLNGNSISVCHKGRWLLPPTCVKTCPVLMSESVDFFCTYQGEIVSCKSIIVSGTKATLSCKDSYKIPISVDPGYRELTCLERGEWDRPVFQCIPECGMPAAPVNPLIVNGSPAKYGEFPWHVGIYSKSSTSGFDQICGGVLLSSNLVISAAHCFYDETRRRVLNARNFAVAAGKYYRAYNITLVEPYAQKSEVKQIDVASRYFGRSGNYAHDIALVRTTTRFNMTALIRPICIDWDNSFEGLQLRNGSSGKVVGWGRNAQDVPSFGLQGIYLPYVPYEDCIATVPEDFKGFVTPDKFCAGYLNGSSLCNGDSGGGLCFQLYGLWYLRGIVSVGPSAGGTCDNNYYTVFTNVSSFLEWIRAAYLSAG